MTNSQLQAYINRIIKENNSKSEPQKSNGLNKALVDNKIAVGKPKKPLVIK